jgi:hypothetical protein
LLFADPRPPLADRKENRIMKRLTSTLAPVAVAATALLAGCLGGPSAPSDDDDDDSAADAAVSLNACQTAMADAPIDDPAYGFRDTLATATRNAWDAASIPGDGQATYPGGKYRTLTADSAGDVHPGCTTDGLAYTAAAIPGFPCAARQFDFPAGVTEDPAKPIVILVHGNSETPTGWIRYVHPDPGSLDFPADETPRDQLAERLPALGYRTIAVDMRYDRVDDPPSPEGQDTGNTPKNMDHGWGVPIVQEAIKRIVVANPDRRITLLGFSLGATVVRDAVRRLWVEWVDGTWDVNLLGRLDDVILASGTHHGVVSFAAQCGANRTMRGTVTCEMGQRNTYSQTVFHRPLNGPAIDPAGQQFAGWYETPCADGDYAFGRRGVCEGNAIQYTTITMQDLENGSQQDEFVSEHASRLYPTACAHNVVTGLNDFDASGYFYNGFFRNHYGSVRSDAGLGVIVAALED